jgi:hypothetical protein
VAIPAPAPDITPVPAPAVATAVAPELHVPPPVPSLSVMLSPVQILDEPDMADGVLFTVTMADAIQLPPSEYVTMVVPVAIPVTTPVPAPTVATDGAPDVHVPPPASVSAVVAPVHTRLMPVMAGGAELTVTMAVTAQPLGSE